MITDQRCRLKIARIDIDVPIYKDVETTRAIAREVDERIKKVEKETEIIDTQKNAVIAAFDCLVEMRTLITEHEEDIQELAKSLERLTSQMKSLEKRFHLTPLPRDDE
ncbi:MAG: cell division protein ZapA [Candidatus Hydrogenedentes bacterium]|nr:cell division protein ZapA [Candidatus Hydrogenedentota bacterium]